MTKTQWVLNGEPIREPLHYPDCGLDDVYLLSGYETLSTPHGDGVKVKHLDGLHAAIGRYLATEKKVLTGKELRFLRVHMDVTQAELGTLIGLSSQQVARWEKGECEISGPADSLLRLLYLAHTSQDEGIRIHDLLKALAERDSNITERHCFEETDEGWRPTTRAA